METNDVSGYSFATFESGLGGDTESDGNVCHVEEDDALMFRRILCYSSQTALHDVVSIQVGHF